MHFLADARRLFLPLLVLAGLMFSVEQACAGPYAAFVADLESERVLYERNSEELRHPASLTKMMTLYLLFEALSRRELTLESTFRVSANATNRPPSKLGVHAGDLLSVEDALLALVTRSANDAAAVIAEGMAGSESAFAYVMNEKARHLGMRDTVFRNANGLPDPRQVTTARDMFRLGKALYKHFPQYYPYFSTASFYYQGHSFHNHNHMLENYPGADGIKTGFINASGFNLVASAKRNGHRIIGVVFGGTSAVARDNLMAELLDDGFDQLDGAEPRTHFVAWDRTELPGLLERPRADESFEAEADDLPPPPPRRMAAVPLPRVRDTLKARIPVLPRLPAPRPLAHMPEAKFAHTGKLPKAAAPEKRPVLASKAATRPRHPEPAVASAVAHKAKRIVLAENKGHSKDAAGPACASVKRRKPGCTAVR